MVRISLLIANLKNIVGTVVITTSMTPKQQVVPEKKHRQFNGIPAPKKIM